MRRERAARRHLTLATTETGPAIAPRRAAGDRAAEEWAAEEWAAEETLGTYLEGWLWGKQSLRPSTHASYELHIRRYLTPHLGDLPLTGVRPLHIERMYRALTQGDQNGSAPVSVSTLRRIHATLMSAMNTALRRGLVERNPAATVELPHADRPQMSVWSTEELGRFLALTADEPLSIMFVLLGLVGLRRGEAVALRWCDVDLDAGRLRVEQTSVRVGGRTVIGPPKSSAGRRAVALDEETCRRLRGRWRSQGHSALSSDDAALSTALVFTADHGRPLDPAYVSRLFARLVERHGLRPIRLHDLRHTSASLGLAAGESLVEVSRRLGHSSITITADIYSHVSPEVAKGSAERLAQSVYRTTTHDRANTGPRPQPQPTQSNTARPPTGGRASSIPEESP